MKPLLIIHTWEPDHVNHNNDMCRGTYLYTWGYFLDHLFVFDNTRKSEDLLPDEIRVDVPSGMFNTSFKTRKAIEVAYHAGYTHVCYAPTDCYIIVPRLLRNLADHTNAGHDYWGFHTYDEHHIGGGSAYWVSRRAMDAVLAYDVYPDYEDRWVGSACRAAGIPAIHDERYRSIDQPYLAQTITTHLSVATGQYDPETMKTLHLQTIMGSKYATEDLTL
jgi:hypothetical protein